MKEHRTIHEAFLASFTGSLRKNAPPILTAVGALLVATLVAAAFSENPHQANKDTARSISNTER